MNRPRNRQPRPGHQNSNTNNSGNNNKTGNDNRHNNRGPPRSSRAPATPQQAAGTVPTVSQVIPGASVFIILKEDQPTGQETAGVVQDVLTRGNHPRGIKVRLRDGQVGRVQRMATSAGAAATGSTRFTMRYTDVRQDEFLEGPPPRSLADFMPEVEVPRSQPVEAVKCPFCEEFEGDEVAVTHHIDQEHLT